jgi:CRP-like cAMP-binding protein
MEFKRKFPEIFSDPAVRKNPMFAGFNALSLRDIAPFFYEQKYEAGESLKFTDTFFIVKTGLLQITEIFNGSNYEDSKKLTPGESAGDLNLLRPGFMQLNCKALETTELIQIEREGFLNLAEIGIRSANRFYLNLCTMLCARYDDLNNRYTRLYLEKFELEQ